MEQEVLEYLDRLRESGVTNMFGASPYIVKEFDISRKEASELLIKWMKKNKLPLVQRDKDKLISRLTLLDTSAYRCIGHVKTGKFTREPTNYRNRLAEIYGKLDEEDLRQLLTIKWKDYEF